MVLVVPDLALPVSMPGLLTTWTGSTPTLLMDGVMVPLPRPPPPKPLLPKPLPPKGHPPRVPPPKDPPPRDQPAKDHPLRLPQPCLPPPRVQPILPLPEEHLSVTLTAFLALLV